MRDLWGFDKLDKDDLKDSPHGILREQAAIFEKKTSDTLIIYIKTRKIPSRADSDFGLATNFDIVAPALDGYSYTLFTVLSKPEKDYPVVIICSQDKKEDWEVYEEYDYSCYKEDDFIQALGEILGSEETTKIIKNLYSKSFF